ncbi:hypothetical protein HPB52_024122 [Rhipicephalus sanguineus]|uniref:CCHC-type domain-containing protein n=1 Tax=Rhipicephalus sanguineus TaxID=34632 RepID=A0A9D4QDN2_RHISA|nr:hypothetical protein HPB52_024122 [Rhipicephalus sanguineus]
MDLSSPLKLAVPSSSGKVVCLDSGKVYSVDLLGALSMLADAWKSTASKTLRNCFRHAGFVLNGESAALDEDSVVDQVSGSEQLINDLRTAGVEIPSNVSFSMFAFVDSELEQFAGPTDEEIIRQVLAECAENGHTHFDCQEPLRCTDCGQRGHRREECDDDPYCSVCERERAIQCPVNGDSLEIEKRKILARLD